MFEVMFWRRRRPWWQRLAAGFELKAPAFSAPRLEVPRLEMPRVDVPHFGVPGFGASNNGMKRVWSRGMEMPWMRGIDIDMPRVRGMDMPRFEQRWPWQRRSEMTHMGGERFDFGRWWPYLAAAATVGGLLVFFLDPQMGRRRRAMARDQLAGQVRHTGRRLTRTGRGVGAWTYGVAQKVTHPRFFQGDAPDDVALVDRVRAELYRHDVPKGQININAVDGVVELRGQVDHAFQVGRIEALVRAVPGVHGVHNYLHTPDTPAPNKAEVYSLR